MKKRWLLVPVIGLILILPGIGQMTLSFTERTVEKKFPVPNISHQELRERIDDNRAPLLFDTRKMEEFVVGRLKDAIQIDPDMEAEAFMNIHGNKLKDRDVVFYCSVGYRSSIFLERVEVMAEKAGAGKLFNLRGGIFRWYNENNPVYDEDGETGEIHPYDAVWGALVVKRKK